MARRSISSLSYFFCLLLIFWSVTITILMFMMSGPDDGGNTENRMRLIRNVENRVDNNNNINREYLDQLHKDVKELQGALKNFSNDYINQDSKSDTSKNDNKKLQDKDKIEEIQDEDKIASPESPPLPNTLLRINTSIDSTEPIAVLVIACNRVSVSKCIDTLLRYRSSKELFPIIVSQDCDHRETSDLIDSYGDKLSHIKQPDLSDFDLKGKEKKMKGYFKISRHYKWALSQVFDVYGYKYAVIVEDDLEVAPDFFSYMQATRPLLATDKSIMCISAWNDNGKKQHIDLEAIGTLYRTDFFPGLGWMLTAQLWNELKDDWPLSYWDEWLRLGEQRKGRSCIRPEVSRTSTFGKKGVSHGQYYEQHLKYIVLNANPYDFLASDLNYLLKINYEEQFVKRVLNLRTVTLTDILHYDGKTDEEVQIKYSSIEEFKTLAKRLKIMDDLRANVSRTAYKGIVSLKRNGRQIHLTTLTTD